MHTVGFPLECIIQGEQVKMRTFLKAVSLHQTPTQHSLLKVYILLLFIFSNYKVYKSTRILLLF